MNNLCSLDLLFIATIKQENYPKLAARKFGRVPELEREAVRFNYNILGFLITFVALDFSRRRKSGPNRLTAPNIATISSIEVKTQIPLNLLAITQ